MRAGTVLGHVKMRAPHGTLTRNPFSCAATFVPAPSARVIGANCPALCARPRLMQPSEARGFIQLANSSVLLDDGLD